jgi:three-Cys-motif partner protein
MFHIRSQRILRSIVEDGLPIAEVGEWALEKHERLKKYVDITRAPRRKYTVPTPAFPSVAGAAYIDLFSGPGRARIRETGGVIDGSPLVAFRAAQLSGVPYSDIHIGDLNERYVHAAADRIRTAGGFAHAHVGTAEQTAKEIVARLNPKGLHFAFLDPFNLEALTFETIRTLSGLEHVDLLLHVSVQDLQRNSERYSSAEASQFDAFAPGWRETVDLNQSIVSFRAALIAYWQSLIEHLGFAGSRVEQVVGSRRQRLYWLAYFSRHPLGNDMWDKIRNLSGQRDLF